MDITFDKPIDVSPFLSGDHVLTLGIDPEAHKRRGVYFHYSDDSTESHSKGFVSGDKFFDTADREWMIRAYFTVKPEGD